MKKSLSFLVLVFFTLSFLNSCNTSITKEIKEFEKAVITDVATIESGLGFGLKLENKDSLIGLLNKEDFKNFEEISSQLKENQTINFKGVLHESVGLFNFKQTPNTNSERYIVIKELQFIEED